MTNVAEGTIDGQPKKWMAGTERNWRADDQRDRREGAHGDG